MSVRFDSASNISGRQLAPFGQGSRAVSFENVAAMGLGSPVFSAEAEMQYAGQGHRVIVQLPNEELLTAQALCDAFEEAYRASYGSILTNRQIGAFTWRVTAQSGSAVVTLPDPTVAMADTAVKGQRLVHFPEARNAVDCHVYDRYGLRLGARLDGPAIIEERESTIVVGPSATARVDERLNVILEMLT